MYKVSMIFLMIYSVSVLLVSCEIIAEDPHQFGVKSIQYDNIDYQSYINSELVEIKHFIDLLSRVDVNLLKEVVDDMQAKQGMQKRAMYGNDRKRPGWELAYGKKKRSIE